MKPQWLDKKIDIKKYAQMKQVLRKLRVETVCEQAMCPNAGECFSRNEATFLILGKYCTRMCSFCNVEKRLPLPVDMQEPQRVAEAAAYFSLKHVVITSVTRDDLSDGGAEVFARTVLAIRKKTPDVTIEILIPDFKLSPASIEAVVRSVPDIIAHNIETVPSLYDTVHQGADYNRSIGVLSMIKKISSEMNTKSGIMLGLGEKEEEVYSSMKDLREAGCDFLSIGQYLAPSKKHYPVKEYITPENFDRYKEKGMELGFAHIESGPYVRSSYMAGRYMSNEKC
jgi:lipoic acid synthetase